MPPDMGVVLFFNFYTPMLKGKTAIIYSAPIIRTDARVNVKCGLSVRDEGRFIRLSTHHATRFGRFKVPI